jgi:chemotaxis protein CheX
LSLPLQAQPQAEFRCKGEVLEVRVCLAPSEQSSHKQAEGNLLMVKTEKVVDYVREATESVFTTMLDMEVQASPQRMDKQSPASSGGVLSFVGMAGAWAGTGVISCSTEFACRVCAALLMTEATSVNEEVLDAMGELTNMIIGNFKNMVEEDLGPMGLSIPTVIYGRNFTSRSAGQQDWVVVPFTCGEEKLEIRICLAPSRDKESPKNGYTHPATVLA